MGNSVEDLLGGGVPHAPVLLVAEFLSVPVGGLQETRPAELYQGLNSRPTFSQRTELPFISSHDLGDKATSRALAR